MKDGFDHNDSRIKNLTGPISGHFQDHWLSALCSVSLIQIGTVIMCLIPHVVSVRKVKQPNCLTRPLRLEVMKCSS